MRILKSTFVIIFGMLLLNACNQNRENESENSEGDLQEKQSTEAMNPDKKAAETEVTAATIDAYLQLKDALVSTDPKKAGTLAEKLAVATESGKIRMVAEKIAAADEVDAQRKAFEDLSKEMYEALKNTKPGKKLYVQYCPMAFNNKGAYWLAAEKEINNPYFGDQMLHCGRIEEEIGS